MTISKVLEDLQNPSLQITLAWEVYFKRKQKKLVPAKSILISILHRRSTLILLKEKNLVLIPCPHKIIWLSFMIQNGVSPSTPAGDKERCCIFPRLLLLIMNTSVFL